MGPVSLSTFAYGRCDLTTANGTFETCRRMPRMSAYRVARKWSADRQNDAIDPQRTSLPRWCRG